MPTRLLVIPGIHSMSIRPLLMRAPRNYIFIKEGEI